MIATHGFRPLPPELVAVQEKMEGHARDYGLDCFQTIFEMVDAEQLNAVAAYGGFPTRYPHWRFGMEFEQLTKSYEYGLQKIQDPKMTHGDYSFYFMDRDGNWWEIQCIVDSTDDENYARGEVVPM